VDRTELKGSYAIVLDLSREEVRTDAAGPALIATVERFGLKLESGKMPIETIVVDHLEKTPTGN
jgi:uncharacterized protein (TIGR03435 family)